MKQILLLGSVLILSTGCGHNFGANSKGIGVRVAWNPDSIMPEATIGYYEVGTIFVRENAKAQYYSDSIGVLESTEVGGEIGTQLTIETQAQANGYSIKNSVISN